MSNVRYGPASLLGDAAGRRQIVLPLDGQERLLAIVAVFAGGHDVAAHAPTTTAERHDVIHGQFMRRKRALAVCTAPLGNFIAPPLGLT